MSTSSITRRQAAALLLMPPASATVRRASGAIEELKLPPEALAELADAALPALKEAEWLEALPLDGLAPALLFIPR